MRPCRHVTLLALVVALLCLPACVRHSSINPDSVEVCHSGRFDMAGGEVDKTIYMDVQGQTRGLETLTSATASKLRTAGWQIAATPSEAGHILHLNVLYSGQSEPSVLRQAVTNGYGSPIRMGQGATTGLVSDALLVQRRVPQSKRPSHVRLKNISTRNAVGNSQMRFGLLLPHGLKGIPPVFAEVLSREIAQALRP